MGKTSDRRLMNNTDQQRHSDLVVTAIRDILHAVRKAFSR